MRLASMPSRLGLESDHEHGWLAAGLDIQSSTTAYDGDG